MAKFRPGDYIRVSKLEDIAYNLNNLYEVLEVHEDYYTIRSVRLNEVKDTDELKFIADIYKVTVIEFFDTHYRLATEAEKVLYGT